MSRTIIIYYSHTGNTKRLAELVQQKTGADIAEIRTVQEYTGTYDEILEQGKEYLSFDHQRRMDGAYH